VGVQPAQLGRGGGRRRAGHRLGRTDDQDPAQPAAQQGAISAERDGRRYLYSPVLTREAWVQQQSEGLLARLFGGRVAPLVAHFSERGKLSAADIAELKRLVSELEEGEGDGR
jgi:Predicted transcriptional regulator